jgi:anti-anti-sigma factor
MLSVDLEQHGEICIARFRGRITAGSDLEDVSAKAERIKQLACAKLLVDFSQVHSIGSTGIGFLVGLYISMRKKPNGVFVLAGVNPRVREVLDLTRLSSILPLAADEAAGLQFLKGRRAGAS